MKQREAAAKAGRIGPTGISLLRTCMNKIGFVNRHPLQGGSGKGRPHRCQRYPPPLYLYEQDRELSPDAHSRAGLALISMPAALVPQVPPLRCTCVSKIGVCHPTPTPGRVQFSHQRRTREYVLA